MLNYSDQHRKDANISKYILKCGIKIAIFLGLSILIYKFSSETWSFLCNSVAYLSNIVSKYFVAFILFLVPLFKFVGGYSVLFAIIINLWAVCVTRQIDVHAESSINKWKKICLGTSIFGIVIAILFVLTVLVGNNHGFGFDKYSEAWVIAIYYFLFTVIFVNISIDLDRKENKS